VEILAEDGHMARRPQLEKFATAHGLKIGSIADLIRHRLATERTVVRVAVRNVDTAFGPFRLIGYRDALTQLPHFALVRGRIDDGEPVLARVHVRDTLADALQLARADRGVTLADALRRVAQAGRGVVVVLTDPDEATAALERIAQSAPPPQVPDPEQEWRRHGAGAQILADLGAHHLIVLGTQRRFSGLSGFGLEVVGYEAAD
jgi:3,4-dihydroxy 2-butanone 4-phosphate synthase/GTP cyclohydrolase II